MHVAQSSPDAGPARWTRLLPSARATADLAERLAPLVGAGDALLLSGSIGAGKTHFARALIQARLRAVGLSEDVPSPTFTLVQTYFAGELEIWHADLYRLGGLADVDELGLSDAFETALTLVEWPDRLDGNLPDHRLELEFTTLPEEGQRSLNIVAHGAGWHPRIEALSGVFRD